MSEFHFKKNYPFDYFNYKVDPKTKIASLTLKNPEPRKGNTAPFFADEQLVELIDAWEHDENVKVVTILADGEHFCSGHDMGEYLGAFRVEGEKKEKRKPKVHDQLLMERELHNALKRFLFSLKPIVTGVHGRCFDWGNHLQAFSDISIAANDAHIGSLGQTAGAAGISWFRVYASLIGFKRARAMWTTGRTFSGKDSALIGLVNRSVPRKRLAEAVMEEAHRIALLPLDGVVTGKAFTHMVLESMGLGKAASELYVSHVLALKIGFEPDEFWFFNEVRRNGVKEALRKRKERYGMIGGFGEVAETSIIDE